MSSIVHLNVGGKRYDTSYQTITRVPDSMLTAMVERWDEAEIFIDRDGKPFQFILNYLRDDSRAILPDDVFQMRQLSQEAVFFILPELKEICDEKLREMVGAPQDPVETGAKEKLDMKSVLQNAALSFCFFVSFYYLASKIRNGKALL